MLRLDQLDYRVGKELESIYIVIRESYEAEIPSRVKIQIR